ncbi:Cold shock-like protein CspG [Portunus trituberculatus]|uniref:Cold shock-like protein CspG n=1 Tax=Portunus trituberculatus TaxID=210409 RepID=A0A5B7GT05_PORTR|nr:Cold shock-like protein CspG [Portunus trituberculatus]
MIKGCRGDTNTLYRYPTKVTPGNSVVNWLAETILVKLRRARSDPGWVTASSTNDKFSACKPTLQRKDCRQLSDASPTPHRSTTRTQTQHTRGEENTISGHRFTMASPDHLQGLVKWYNIKAGYGFITLPQQGKDVFVHTTGLTRSLKETPPREGDHVFLNLRQGDKGPEARDVAWSEPPSRQPTKKPPSSRKTGKKEDITGKIYACVYTAKAIAGTDLCRLQQIIPILLQHNGLPVISIPLTALSAPPRSKMRPTRRPSAKDHPRETQDNDAYHLNQPRAEEGEEEGNRTEPHDDHEDEDEDDEEEEDEDEEEDDEEEDEEVDVLGSCSEKETPPPQPSKPKRPSVPQPPSGKQDEDDGWVTKQKRRRRPKDDPWVLPKEERTTTPSAALSQSPTIARLRLENQSGKVD